MGSYLLGLGLGLGLFGLFKSIGMLITADKRIYWHGKIFPSGTMRG